MGFAVWSHHMFTTGLGPVANTAFSLTSFVIGVPTGVKIFNWLGTIWGGKVRFTTAMLFALGFIVTFTLGGITGIMLAMPPFDAQAQDSYFVVAHFHYAMGGGALLSFFAATYYWFPKMTGRMLSERLGRWVFTLIALGFHMIFFPLHIAGLLGMPRRIQTYAAGLGFDFWNLLSTIGTFVMGAGLLLFLYSVIQAFINGKPAGNDPWDGRTLEWSTTSPPPYYNFAKQPVVQELDDFWAQKYPESVHVEAVDPESHWQSEEHGIHIPGQSWYPIIAAAGIFIGGYAVIYDNWWLAALMLGVIVFSTYGWAFEGIGGRHIHPEEPA